MQFFGLLDVDINKSCEVDLCNSYGLREHVWRAEKLASSVSIKVFDSSKERSWPKLFVNMMIFKKKIT